MISLVKNPADAATSGNSAEQKPVEARRLHRLRSVRQSEHVFRRAMAIRLKTDVQSVIQQEESADLLLSTLHQWLPRCMFRWKSSWSKRKRGFRR